VERRADQRGQSGRQVRTLTFGAHHEGMAVSMCRIG
jgi:hypothetical protein